MSQFDVVPILGVPIHNLSMAAALAVLEDWLPQEVAHTVFIANAHTCNMAHVDSNYGQVLRNSDIVLGDGTGVRWAARQHNVRMRDNLVGTDLVPLLFQRAAGKGYRYFLLGAQPGAIERAAEHCSHSFPGWTLAGYRHGYNLDNQQVVDQINDSNANLLLVAMGNPLQEQWLASVKHRLEVPVSIGVGGLFDHWAGNLTRAPLWVRNLGLEWLQLMLQQPSKAGRYLLGNPAFVARVLLAKLTDDHE